jgi:arylsulfatase
MNNIVSISIISIILAASQASWAADQTDRPDIVIIMADDMGYSDIGCYGGEIRTPNLDALAGKGLRFTQFYNTARCCPTRASLLTGLYPHQAGIGHMMNDRGVPGYRGDLNDRSVTIAEVLRSAGYATLMSGKWHVTRFVEGPKHNWPLQRGFDKFYGTIHGAGSFYDPVSLTRGNTPLDSPPGDFYYTDAISDNAVNYITDHAASSPDQPFFLYVSYTAPHWPLHALEEDIERYRGRYAAGWDALRVDRIKRMKDMDIIDPAWALTERDPSVPAWEDADHKAWEARRMEVYAAQIDRMDQGIGTIVTTLDQTGRLDNTLILFLADNGGCAEELTDTWTGRHIPSETRDGRAVRLGNNPDDMPGAEDTYQSYGVPWANASNTPFRLYKHWVHEGGIATPLIAHWPARITAHGELRSQPGHLVDLMATCVEVGQASYPESTQSGQPVTSMEGESLLAAFDGQSVPRDALYWEHEGNRAIRIENWKLVARGQEGPWELYHLARDRTETNDLAMEHPVRVEEMAAHWQQWAKRTHVIPRKQEKDSE